MRHLVTARRLCTVNGCPEHADTLTDQGWMCPGHAALDWQQSRRRRPPRKGGAA